MATTSNLSVSMTFTRACAPHPEPRTTIFFFASAPLPGIRESFSLFVKRSTACARDAAIRQTARYGPG